MSVRFGPKAESVRRWGGWPLILGAVLGLGVAANPHKSFAERIGPIRPGPGLLVGFSYAPEGWNPSREQREALRRETVRLDRELAVPEKRTPVRLRQRSILLLADAKESEAVERLEQALENLPAGHPVKEEADLRSDLAAAHLQLFAQRGKPVALLDALDSAEKATELGSSRIAKFNLALSLQRLFLKAEAAREWKSLAGRNPFDAESQESRSNLEKLNRPSPATRWQTLLENPRWLDSPSMTAAIVSEFPQQVRTFAQEELFADWGKAMLANRSLEALRLLSQVLSVGKSLEAFNGERSILDSAEALRRLDVRQLASASQAHIEYATGRVSFERLDLDSAERSLSQALKLFEEVNPSGPSYLWTKYWLACIAYYRQEHPAAITKFTDLLGHQDLQRYPALRGRLLWSLGLEHLLSARYFDSHSFYAKSMQIFRDLRETENLGTLEYLFAENLDLLGRTDEAWSYRNRALSHLSEDLGSVRRLNQLLQLSRALSQAGKEHAAYTFVSEALATSRANSQQVQMCEALVVRASLGTQIEAYRQARDDLRSAEACVEKLRNASLRERLRLERDIASATLLARDSPEKALFVLGTLVSTAERSQRTLDIPQLLQARARVYLKLMDFRNASLELERGMKLIEEVARRSQSEREKRDLLALWQPLYDDGLNLYGFKAHDMVGALSVVERSRGQGPLDDGLVREIGEKLPSQVTLVRMSTTSDGILVWVIGRNQARFYSRPIDGNRLSSLVGIFEATLKTGEIHFRANQALFSLIGSVITEGSESDDVVVLVPDGKIANLTFAALRNPLTGRPLIAERALTYFTGGLSSLVGEAPSSIGQCERHDLKVVAVGNPTVTGLSAQHLASLPQAARDSSEIESGHARTLLLNGDKATRKNVLEGMRDAEILYFAGHSGRATSEPLESKLFLAGDDQLQGAEIEGLPLDHLCLVVLASCESARIAEARTYGAGSLAASFITAGAQAVIGNTWAVSDEAAKALVKVQKAVLAGQPIIQSFRSMQVSASRKPREVADGALSFRLLITSLHSKRG